MVDFYFYSFKATETTCSAVHLHLKDRGHSLEDSNVHILVREDIWFERGVKESVCVKLK